MFYDRYNGITLGNAVENAGGYVNYVPGKPLIIDYDYRAMSGYCRKKGKKQLNYRKMSEKCLEYDPPLFYRQVVSYALFGTNIINNIINSFKNIFSNKIRLYIQPCVSVFIHTAFSCTS